MILVAGATGNVGGELVAALAGAGEQVRALVRGPDRPVPAGVQRALGDLNDPPSLRRALAGVQAVFLLSGYKDMAGLLAEVHRAGVERVVLMSGSAVLATDTDNAISRYQIASEEAVRGAGVEWTIIRPSAFMSNALRWLPQIRAGDLVRAEFPDVANAVIDPHDIAAVAAVALTSDGNAGQVYRVTGPVALRPADQVRIIGERIGREIGFEGKSNDEARADMLTSTPPEYVEAFFSFYVDGTLDESPVLPTVEQVTGRPPRTFAQWVGAHADEFG